MLNKKVTFFYIVNFSEYIRTTTGTHGYQHFILSKWSLNLWVLYNCKKSLQCMCNDLSFLYTLLLFPN